VRTTALRLAIVALLLGGTGAYLLVRRASEDGVAQACPPGYVTQEARERMERREQRAGGESGEAERAREAEREREEHGEEGERRCFTRKHPEPKGELMTRDTQASARVTAPASQLKPGAYAAAARSAKRLGARVSSLPGAAGDWAPAGNGPLIDDDPDYPEVNGQGLADLQGRISDFTTGGGRLFAAVGEGGVWVSDDVGAHWRSIGDALPTQAVGSVAYSTAGGGTLLALTGDSVFGGGSTYAGAGLYRSTNLGQSWQKASGVPDGVIAFKVAVDPTNPQRVYAATGGGLYRSTDAGATFTDVALPTGCRPYTDPDCFLANMVTDVAVQQSTGAVTAAVGWRAGNKPSAGGGDPESPNNGIYMSPTGAPGSFAKAAATGFTPQNQIGRIELGGATGADQDHDYLYAIVEDAVKFNTGVEVLDVDGGNDNPTGVPANTALDGVYVSDDFGATWTKMARPEDLQAPGTGSALTGVACTASLYCPGIQAWYNAWIKPDPTAVEDGCSADCVPTRLTFGLEEVWQNRVLAPQSGEFSPLPDNIEFEVVGPYFSGDTCQFLNLTTGEAGCPTTGDPTIDADTTTHPDQHSATYVPQPGGGVTFVVGHDGGANTQTAAAGEKFREDRWGRGANQGFNTLLPYDAQVSKDGTIWAGLQDNGEMKIEPSGRQVGTYGGDGGYSAVDPDNADVAYEEYTFADIRSTTNGGKSWTDTPPPDDDGYQFINPFVMDPTDAKHLLTAGQGVYETANAPAADWTKVYDLGTGPDDTPNKVSAVDLRGAFEGASSGTSTGPATANFDWTGGTDTVPGADASTQFEAPGTFSDKPFTIKPNEANGKATITVTWANDSDDWDMRVLKGDEVVGESLSTGGSGHSEQVSLTAPKPGDYTIRVYNYAATPGTGFSGTARFQRAAGTDVTGDGAAAYVGFCGYCDPLNTRPFGRGLATNVGGDKPPKRLTGDGWHKATAAGLPNRYITSVQMDPADPRTVYVTLGGYSRRWLPVGALGENTPGAGSGHVFKSTDAGEHFTDISANLPDAPAEFTLVRNGQLIVATDVGVYISPDTDGAAYDTLGKGLPTAPVYSLELKPGDANTLIVATQGRGVYRYTFAAPPPKNLPRQPGGGAPAPGGGTGPVACTASRGFRSASASGAGRSVRFAFARRERNPVQVDVFQQSRGRRVLGERLVARFSNRSRSFTWNGRGNRGRRLTDGVYFARLRIRYANRRLRDFRRTTLARSGGRWTKRPQFYKAASCGLLRSYKLTRPVFGGTGRRSLGIAYRLARRGRVTVDVLRGSRRVLRFAARSRRANRTYRVTLKATGRPRGDYRVRIAVRSGRATVRSVLVSRRL
jgi:Bacterial pre-peptidase C-terminal domain